MADLLVLYTSIIAMAKKTRNICLADQNILR